MLTMMMMGTYNAWSARSLEPAFSARSRRSAARAPLTMMMMMVMVMVSF